MPFYAVKRGRVPGIYETWKECQLNISGFSGAKFHKFNTIDEAEEFMNSKDYSINNHNSNNMKISFPCAFVDGSYNPTKFIVGSGILIKDNQDNNNFTEITKTYDAKDEKSEMRISRNIYGEIKACEEAIKYALDKKWKEINIYYDYLGIEMFGNKQWSVNREKKFISEYIKFIENVRKNKNLKINFYKVPAHSGIIENEKVDILAKKAAGFEI